MIVTRNLKITEFNDLILILKEEIKDNHSANSDIAQNIKSLGKEPESEA